MWFSNWIIFSPIKSPEQIHENITDDLQCEHLYYFTIDSKKWLHAFHCNGISDDMQEIHFLSTHCEVWWNVVNTVNGLTAVEIDTHASMLLELMKKLNYSFV